MQWNIGGFELVVISSIVPVMVLLLFLVVVRFNPLFSKQQNIMLVSAVLVNLLLILVVGADFLLSGSFTEYAWALRRVTSFLNFACSPIVPLLLYQIYNVQRAKLWFYLPAVLNLVICAVSMFYQVVFYISEENGYGRGPLFLVPFGTALFYILLIFFKPTKTQPRSKRVERMLLVAIMLILVFSMYLEIALHLRMITWNSSAAGLVLYYLLLNVHNFAVDPLTGAYNRIMYNRALETANGAAPCTLALIDINDFKQVNDLHGHAEGDRCLVEFTQILSESFRGCATLYRIGGDEFALVSRGRAQERFAECLRQARQAAGEKEIFFACGVSEYSGQGDIEENQRAMDRRMYENKSQQKQG